MWNDHRSVLLSKLCIIFFMGVLLTVASSAPWLVRWLVGFSRAELGGMETYFLVTIYTATLPAALLLYNLYGLLQRIAAGQVFLPENVDHLRRISWNSFAGGLICLVSAFYYFPWLLVAIAAGFMGLIVRVVKNVVAQAVSLQHEVDLTI
jgi:hypothetical protein